MPKARFIRRISAVSNAIETIDNEMICLIIFCLNCIRHGRNATYEPGLSYLNSMSDIVYKNIKFQFIQKKIVSFNYRLTHSASELSGFTCTSSLTMNSKFSIRPRAVLKISSSLFLG